jgi:hypothetical protein
MTGPMACWPITAQPNLSRSPPRHDRPKPHYEIKNMKTPSLIHCLFATAGLLSAPLASPAANLVVTNLADSGPGTLRQVIANALSGDTITFATSGTITLTGGPLFITKSVNISGPGPASIAVDGHFASRVFELESGFTGSISGLTIQNGRYPNGGGLGNFGNLVLSNCVITGNAAGPSGFGGAIHNGTTGALTLIACSVNNNAAGNGADGADGAPGHFLSPDGQPGGNGGTGGNGGGIYNEGMLNLTACSVTNNKAGSGGRAGNGGYGWGFFGNGGYAGYPGSGAHGGGIFNQVSGTLSLSNCTVSDNTSGSGGAGGQPGENGIPVYNQLASSGSVGGSGAGIYNLNVLTLTNCTVSNNAGGKGGDGASWPHGLGSGGGSSSTGGGIWNGGSGALTMKGCTISGNTTGHGGYGAEDHSLDRATLPARWGRQGWRPDRSRWRHLQ